VSDDQKQIDALQMCNVYCCRVACLCPFIFIWDQYLLEHAKDELRVRIEDKLNFESLWSGFLRTRTSDLSWLSPSNKTKNSQLVGASYADVWLGEMFPCAIAGQGSAWRPTR